MATIAATALATKTNASKAWTEFIAFIAPLLNSVAASGDCLYFFPVALRPACSYALAQPEGGNTCGLSSCPP